jgi:hypothetical protein
VKSSPLTVVGRGDVRWESYNYRWRTRRPLRATWLLQGDVPLTGSLRVDIPQAAGSTQVAGSGPTAAGSGLVMDVPHVRNTTLAMLGADLPPLGALSGPTATSDCQTLSKVLGANMPLGCNSRQYSSFDIDIVT